MTHIPHTAFGALVLLDTLRIRGRTDVPMVIEPEIGAIDSASHVDAVCAIANSGGGVAYIGTAKHSRYVLRLGTPDHGLVRRVERDLRARVSPPADTRVFAEQGGIIIVVRPSSAPSGSARR